MREAAEGEDGTARVFSTIAQRENQLLAGRSGEVPWVCPDSDGDAVVCPHPHRSARRSPSGQFHGDVVSVRTCRSPRRAGRAGEGAARHGPPRCTLPDDASPRGAGAGTTVTVFASRGPWRAGRHRFVETEELLQALPRAHERSTTRTPVLHGRVGGAIRPTAARRSDSVRPSGVALLAPQTPRSSAGSSIITARQAPSTPRLLAARSSSRLALHPLAPSRDGSLRQHRLRITVVPVPAYQLPIIALESKGRTGC